MPSTNLSVKGDPTFKIHLLLTLCFSNFVIGMGAFVVIGVLQPLAADLEMSVAQSGHVLSYYALGYALTSPFLAVLTGSWPRRRVLLTGLLLFLTASIVASLATHPAWLLGARITSALGAAIFTPAAFSVAVNESALQHRGRALSLVGVGLTLAQVIGVPVGTWLGYTYGWRTAFICVSSLGAIALVLCHLHLPKNSIQQTITLKHLGEAISDFRLINAIAFTALFLSGTYVVFTYISHILAVKLELGGNGISLALMLIGVGAFFGNLLGGVATDRMDPVHYLIGVAICLIVLLPLMTMVNYNLPIGLSLLFIWALISWSFMVPQQSRMVRLKPEAQTVGLALNASCIYLGTALGASVGGITLEMGGLALLGPAAALIVAISLLLLLRSSYTLREKSRS